MGRQSIALLGFLLLFASTNSEPVFCALNWIPYLNTKHGFSIHLPSGWEADEKTAASLGVPGAAVFFWGPYETDTGGTVNMLICVKDVGMEVSLEEQARKEMPSLTGIQSYNILSEKKRVVNNLACYEINGKTIGSTRLGTFTLLQKQVFFVEKGKLYWISFMASQKYYDMYLSAFEESIQTFVLGFPWRSFLVPSLIAVIILGSIAAATLMYRKKARLVQKSKTDFSYAQNESEDEYHSLQPHCDICQTSASTSVALVKEHDAAGEFWRERSVCQNCIESLRKKGLLKT